MKSILIVDDDPEFRANLTEILTEAGYRTDTASTGSEAIKKAAGRDFDAILLDLIMPGMNGMEVLTELKKLGPKSKIIMITAFATVDNAVHAIKRGASDYIAKPFNIDDLLVTIKLVLEEARFEANIKKLDMDYALSSLANPIRRKLIRLLRVNKKMRLMELTRELSIADHTKVIFHLKTLRDSNIVRQDKDKSYHLTREGDRIIDCLNILENYLST
jgi:DNA-binding NtrC family response regulator